MTNLFGEEYTPQPLTMAWEGQHLVLFRGGKYAGQVSANGWSGKLIHGDYTMGEPILTNGDAVLSLAEMTLIVKTWEAGKTGETSNLT